MNRASLKKYLYILPALILVAILGLFLMTKDQKVVDETICSDSCDSESETKTDQRVINRTYCSDLCPSESEWIPFQVYVDEITAEDCESKGGTANYAYGWDHEYIGCTPKGYKTLSQATKEMWANQNR